MSFGSEWRGTPKITSLGALTEVCHYTAYSFDTASIIDVPVVVLSLNQTMMSLLD